MIHLIIGPVGAGKSTYAAQLARSEQGVWLNVDRWMTTLFGDDPRPEEDRMGWYLERVQRCIEQIWWVAEQLLLIEIPVILELGLIQASQRQAFYPKLVTAGSPHTLHVLDAPREVRRARMRQRNTERQGTYSMQVPDAVFEYASDLWEPLTSAELAAHKVVLVPTAPM